jgi:hypothetical protein
MVIAHIALMYSLSRQIQTNIAAKKKRVRLQDKDLMYTGSETSLRMCRHQAVTHVVTSSLEGY